MQNLISNAIKYDGESRWARISAQMWARKQANEVRITVEDRGLGISSADIVHIFEPFYRADPSRSRDSGGAGLGLSIVNAVVAAHGGRVEVKETSGGGATFEVALPLVPRSS